MQPIAGELAQLVERLHGMQEVTGSTPVFSTSFKSPPGDFLHLVLTSLLSHILRQYHYHLSFYLALYLFGVAFYEAYVLYYGAHFGI